MAKLTDAMKELVGTQQCWVATVNSDGTPNVAPKRSTRVAFLDYRLTACGGRIYSRRFERTPMYRLR